ncbi:hypothetical protein CEXT_54591 [Caerostris extrusa]|uniref:Endonuclease/exonuclease/phosphatase domain-containing protein n=1 Tax=Caerostris extrusa TaxID=172846 RepID=A0AAV4WPL1_CAEEX|nr:hypothetical protein CEXT_54591 [Caerostris extrusa]
MLQFEARSTSKGPNQRTALLHIKGGYHFSHYCTRVQGTGSQPTEQREQEAYASVLCTVQQFLTAEEFYSVTDLLGTRISVERYQGRNRVPQCYRCQGFFHSSVACPLPKSTPRYDHTDTANILDFALFKNIPYTTSTAVLNELNSDHLPVLIDIELNRPPHTAPQDFKTNWHDYNFHLQNTNLNTFNIDTKEKADMAIKNFTTAMINAFNKKLRHKTDCTLILNSHPRLKVKLNSET